MSLIQKLLLKLQEISLIVYAKSLEKNNTYMNRYLNKTNKPQCKTDLLEAYIPLISQGGKTTARLKCYLKSLIRHNTNTGRDTKGVLNNTLVLEEVEGPAAATFSANPCLCISACSSGALRKKCQ